MKKAGTLRGCVVLSGKQGFDFLPHFAHLNVFAPLDISTFLDKFAFLHVYYFTV